VVEIFQAKSLVFYKLYLFIYFIVIQNVIITYVLPMGMMPVIGTLNESFLKINEKIVR
jgi:hypothetical protein